MLQSIINMTISIMALIVSIWTYHNNVVHKRKVDTINAYTELQANLYELAKYKPGEIELHVDYGTDEYKMLSSCLARIEIFAAGLHSNIYDFETLYSIAHGYFDGTIQSQIEELIDMKTAISKENYYLNTDEMLKKFIKRH